MLEFIPLASSSAGCSYLFRYGNHAPLLVDAGLPFKHIQKATGFQTARLAGCLVSHSHGDHCAGAADLLRAGVKVYGTLETIEAIAPNGHHRAMVIGTSYAFHVGPWKVKAFEVKHDCEGTVGFLIGIEDATALYLTDTAYSKFTFPGVTHMFVECNHSREIMRQHTRAGDMGADRYKRTAHNHMSLERLLDFFKANDLSKLKEVWLLHLSAGNSDESAFKTAVQKATGALVMVAGEKGGAI